MNDTEKLNAVMELLEREYKKIQAATEVDGEYDSLDGNGTNCCEAYATLSPIIKRARKIYKQ